MVYKIDLRGVLTLENIDEIICKSFCGNMYITTIIIPKTVKTIGAYAFDGCKNLKNIIFEKDSICETIEEMAFNDCNKLESINFWPESLKKIMAKSFNCCFNLYNIPVFSNIKYIDSSAFEGCEFDLFSIKNTNFEFDITNPFDIFKCEKLCIGEKIFNMKYWDPMSVCETNRYEDKDFIIIKGKSLSQLLTNSSESFYLYYDKIAHIHDINKNLREAKNNVEKMKLSNNIEKSRREKWNLYTPISYKTYSEIVGSCYYGVEQMCKILGYDTSKETTGPILEFYKNALIYEKNINYINKFKKFINENVIGGEKV